MGDFRFFVPKTSFWLLFFIVVLHDCLSAADILVKFS